MKRSLPLFAMIGALWACAPEKPQGESAAEAEPTATAAPEVSASAAESISDDNRRSQYTRLGDCKLINRSESGEGDFSDHICAGLGGYAIKLSEDDLRQNLWVRAPGAAEQSLKLSEVTRTGGFSRIGDRIEWRGIGQGGAFRPDALILRYFVIEDPDKPERETSYLLAVSLAGSKPCVTAKVAPGPNQNERAREAADDAVHCLD